MSAPEGEQDPHGRQKVVFSGAITDYWSYTMVRDFTLLMPGLSHTALRLYLLLRSIVIESLKHLDHQGKRRLTIDELCFLLPGPGGKPTSVSTIYQLLKELEGLGLVIPTETLEKTGASKLKGKDRAARGIERGFMVNDFPADAYKGWRNIWDKRKAYRENWREEPVLPPTHLTVPTGSGLSTVHQVWPDEPAAKDPFQDSGTVDDGDGQPGDPFQESGTPVQKSGTPVQNPGKDPSLTSDDAAPKETSEGNSRKKVTRAGGRRPTPVVGGAPDGGFAAPAEQRSHDRKPVPWGDLQQVVCAIPAPLAALLEKDFPTGLPTAVNDAIIRLLAEPRTADEAAERIARRWLRYEDDALSLSGRGLDSPIAVLYELLTPSYCEGSNARCEDGYDLDRQADCPLCVELKEDFRAQRAASEGGDTGVPTPPVELPVQRPEPRPKPLPMRTCDSCDRAFRSAGASPICGECAEQSQYA